MRVLVTGGAGFIGSHIVDALAAGGHSIAVLDNLSTGRLENIKQEVVFYKGDLLDRQFVMSCVGKECPQVIIHQAGQVSVARSLSDPPGDAGANIVGSLNILEAARIFGAGKVVYASSAAVYGVPRYLPVDEAHPLCPLSCYGLSKCTAERYLDLYRQLYGIDCTVLRYANVYGPRQDARGEGGVVAVFINRVLGGGQPAIHGDGGQTRDFVHVRDVAAANLCALDRGGGMTFNVSTGCLTSVNGLFEIVREAAGYRGRPRYDPPRPGDIRESCLDSSSAAAQLGWTARTGLAEGIDETLAWARLTIGTPAAYNGT